MSCRFVRLNMTFVLTRFRSFGTGTNAIGNLLSKRDAAFDLVAPDIPAFGGLTGEKFDARDIAHELDDAVAGFLRFLGVLFDVAHDDLMYTGACPFGMPFVARMQSSALARVQYPMPQKRPSDTRFCLIQTKAVVLYSNPPCLKDL